jgi:hypothetical protein
MTKEDAIEIASLFVEARRGSIPPLIGARPFDKNEWVVLFETVIPGVPPGTIVDGPTVVTVDVRSRTAAFFSSP